MTKGGDFVFFPSAAGGRLSFVATHADVNLWSVAIDEASGTTHGPLRRLTRGAGIVSHLTLAQDGRTLAYFAVGMQTSPHWHEVIVWGAAFWQPHVHWLPLQVLHAQAFDCVVMKSSFSDVDVMSTKGSFASREPGRIGSSGYCS